MPASSMLDTRKPVRPVVPRSVLGGCDWGARTADIVAALWPQRCKALVSVSGYLIGSQAANRTPLPPKAELQWWYQFYFATNAAAPATKKIGAISRRGPKGGLPPDGAPTSAPAGRDSCWCHPSALPGHAWVSAGGGGRRGEGEGESEPRDG